MFATAVWLVTVIADGFGIEATSRVLWFLLALGFGAWLFGLLAKEEEGWPKRLMKLVPILAVLAAVGAYLLDFNDARANPTAPSESKVIDWVEFSEAEVENARRSGKPIFMDFTAQWCMNCKFNEKTVIETEQTGRLLKDLGFVAIRADNTRHNKVIDRWLKKFDRAGVPMYLVYPPCAGDGQAKVLPEILTRGVLDSALKDAASKSFCRD